MTDTQGPVDLFKLALGAATRAISAEPEASVDFGAEAPNIHGARLHLPLPARELPAADVGRARGAADSFALKLRHHDPKVHAARAPAGGPARAVYDAAEQARVEALGARRMKGVAMNLATALEEQFRGRGAEPESLAQEAMDTPVADVVRLLVRERLTGAAAPQAMRPLIELWRPAIEEKAGADLRDLGRADRGPGGLCAQHTATDRQPRDLGGRGRSLARRDRRRPGREPRPDVGRGRGRRARGHRGAG